MKQDSLNKKILITGGTSGLGLELVKTFLSKGFFVVTTGRQGLVMPDYEERFRFYRIDFSDLKSTAESVRAICGTHEFAYIVLNAGILSPPDLILTKDGFEYTLQVNFLAPLLISEIILGRTVQSPPVSIASVTSPVYRLSKLSVGSNRVKRNYSPVKAYSDSKLFLVLMCRHLPEKYKDINLKCFSFIPGIFSSGIYRTQDNWFRVMYKAGALFMRRPQKVANTLAELLTSHEISNGAIYNMKRKISSLDVPDPSVLDQFWKDTYEKIDPFLKPVQVLNE